MMSKKKEFSLVTVCCRVDPNTIKLFKSHCEETKITRSEALREIFTQHIEALKKEKDELNKLTATQ